MAKCIVCDQRKGKRTCRKTESMICSLCCGETRSQDECDGCSFWTPPTRNYGNTPYYSVKAMQSITNENISHAIESALCAADRNKRLTDSTALGIVERLIDHFHFNDTDITFHDDDERTVYSDIKRTLNDTFLSETPEPIVKVLGAIRRSILRHNQGSRGYMNFIRHFVG